MASQFGDTEWITSHHGRLRWHDRLRQLGQGIVAQIRQGSAPKPARRRSMEQITLPDSPLCQAAVTLAREASEPYLFNHCFRAYFFAHLLDPSSQAVDDEALFVAVVLHDLGLTQQYALRPTDDQQCFTAPAAQQAFALARKYGWSDVRARLVADAISLHLNVIVRAEHGREAQLVRLGSGADVVGQGLVAITKPDIDNVVARYPRLNMKREVTAVLEQEAALRPLGRAGFLCNSLQFGKLIARNQFFSE